MRSAADQIGAVPVPRVLLVDLSKRFGGADVRVLQTARALGGRCRIAVAVLDGSPVHHELAASGIETVPIDLRRGDPRMIAALGKAMRRFRPDVVDAHNPQSQGWGMAAAAWTGVRGRLATVHSDYRAAHGGPLRSRTHDAALRVAGALGAHFLVVSQSVRRYVASMGAPEARIHLSYNGMEPLVGPVTPAGLRAGLGLQPGEPIVGIIGRIDPVKGHDVLLAALRHLGDTGRPVHVAVIGDGPGEQDLRNLAERLGVAARVHVLGFRRDVSAVLADLDLVAAPSRSEGLPYAILEAARQGLPLVASRVGGLAELLEDDVTALLVPPGDPAALAGAIARLLAQPDERRRLGEAARAMVAHRFRLDRMAHETLAVYRLLAACPAEPVEARHLSREGAT